MLCPGFGPLHAEVVPDSLMLGHTPVLIRIPDGASSDLGVSILRPQKLRGISCPAHLSVDWSCALAGLPLTTPEACWDSWTGLAESYLLSQVTISPIMPSRSQSGPCSAARGGGGPLRFRRNTPSAPQVREGGLAASSRVLALRKTLTGLQRKLMYLTRGAANAEQARELLHLDRHYPDVSQLPAVRDQLLHAIQELRSARTRSWTQWCQGQWATSKGKVYRYVRQPSQVSATQLHHGTMVPPLTLQDRLDTAVRDWQSLWGRGRSSPVYPGPVLPPITGAEIRHTLSHMSTRKALGADHWAVDELRALPLPFLEGLASFLNLVEDQGYWPSPHTDHSRGAHS